MLESEPKIRQRRIGAVGGTVSMGWEKVPEKEVAEKGARIGGGNYRTIFGEIGN